LSAAKPILVIGGGISGVTAAVEAADTGRHVVLVEQKPYLGGNVVQMNNYFPKLCPPSCGLEINFRRIRQSPRITCHTSTRVVSILGEQDNFQVRLVQQPRYVKDNCAACGDCADVCPVSRPDEFNRGLSTTQAAYLPHEMAFPYIYHIDDRYCTKDACGKCAEACDYDAIDLSAKEEEFVLEAASVIVATGWKSYDAGRIENLHYNEFSDVVTNVEFERLMAVDGPNNGQLKRISDGKLPNDITFVQCAGSRDEKHLPYCSAVCCSASLKHALSVQEKYPDVGVSIFYIDLRVSGRNEDFLARVDAGKNTRLIRGKVSEISQKEDSGDLVVEAEDILSGRKVRHETQLVVLATGIVPSESDPPLSRNAYGFVGEMPGSGIHATACCRKPMDVSSSVKDATGAVLKSMGTGNGLI
jgi:quinone-modifying oxidoreductase subunit QmoA